MSVSLLSSAPIFQHFTTTSKHQRQVLFTSVKLFGSSPVYFNKKPKKKTLKEEFKSKYRNLFVPEEDVHKRPSDLEIRKKDLPLNQPTLGERMNRDVYRLFHQADEKHGYHNLRKYPDSMKDEVMESVKEQLNRNPKRAFKDAFKSVSNEIKKFAKECKEADYVSQGLDALPPQGGSRKEWGFQTPEEMEEWILTKDSDWGEGYSAAEFSLSPLGHAVWRGDLSTRVPADGRTQAAGYVNIASKKKMKSFAREQLMEDWEYFSHLTMNVRGDGRKYMLNIQVKRDFDILWNDRWHYPLYTRGGPYWQYVKIPWSKFYLGSRGVLQDKQFAIPLSKFNNIYQSIYSYISVPECGVVGMSITLMDSVSGPFQLELKDINLAVDHGNDGEQFAYEMYKIPHFWAGH